MTVTDEANKAWTAHALKHPTNSRSDYVNGYSAGAAAERGRIARFLEDNRDTLHSFAGANVAQLLAFMLRELKAE